MERKNRQEEIETCIGQISKSISSNFKMYIFKLQNVQSGASSPAKHGDAYFSAVYGFIQDLIVAPGLYEHQKL